MKEVINKMKQKIDTTSAVPDLHSDTNSFNVFSTRCVQSIVFGLKTCLQPSFVLIVRTLVLPLNTLKTFSHHMLCVYKKEVGEPSGSSVSFWFG